MIGAVGAPRSGAEAHIEGTASTAFGKYHLFASLGRGGMADVFLSVARGQMGFNKLAVIKRLRQALAEEPTFRTMFLDEARLAARLNHPNIVHTYEVGEQSGVYFIAMEYLEGQSLNKVLKELLRRKETIEPEVAARIVADALGALHYAHELRDYDGSRLNIIHRDVSPHNIFVTYEGHTKLVDFGIAKAALSSTETEVGVLKGKVSYMSPEQAMGGPIDARSDLFAMGIVLWELLARQRLMTGDSAANTLHRLMNEPIPRVSKAVVSIDRALDDIVARALEKDPNARFQSAAEMRDALESWLAARPRPARQEDVGRLMQHVFANTRGEVQKQIQRHMAMLTPAANTQEVRALTVESLHRMEQSGANVSGQLLRLNSGGGSGSGVVPEYGAMGSRASMYPALAPSQAPPPASGRHLWAVVLAAGFFLLGLVLFVMVLRERSVVRLGVPALPQPRLSTALADTTASAVVTADPGSVAAGQPTVLTPANASASATTSPSSGGSSATTSAITVPPVSAARTSSSRSAARPVGRPSAAPPPPPPVEDPGYLTLFVYPWAKVSEGGRTVCTTPCNRIQMPAGPHSLLLENADQGIRQTITVVIKSGETTAKQVGLK